MKSIPTFFNFEKRRRDSSPMYKRTYKLTSQKFGPMFEVENVSSFFCAFCKFNALTKPISDQ